MWRFRLLSHHRAPWESNVRLLTCLVALFLCAPAAMRRADRVSDAMAIG